MAMDEKEKELIYEWACSNYSEELGKTIFPLIDKSAKSYFTKRENQEEYLCEYDFQTLPQLKMVLEEMWQDEDYMNAVIKPVLVGAMKNRIGICQENKSSVSGKMEETEELQSFIYSF